MTDWGPDYRKPRTGGRLGRPLSLVALALLIFAPAAIGWIAVGVIAVVVVGEKTIKYRARRQREQNALAQEIVRSGDPGRAVVNEAHRHGSGVFLGTGKDGGWRFSRAERAVLLLGPPRSGKTSGVIIPTVVGHSGPVVSASTKADVLLATASARSRLGRVAVFDPTATGGTGSMAVLRWSPVRCSRAWDGALLIARAMVAGAGVGAGTTDQTHWAKRAQALLAPMLHAAALTGRDIAHVLDWVIRHELDEPGLLLEKEGSPVAMSMLIGVLNTEAKEQSSIFSAAADALDAYTSDAALQAARQSNFDAAQFIASAGTLYIHAPAERQAAAAPLVCGLLAEIRRATYLAHQQQTQTRPVLFALDEAANIAPMPELPAIASEGGGQGLILLACFQDLSQARVRWGTAADGFLTLFGTKLILPGIADTRTLESISLALGEYDRKMIATTKLPAARGEFLGRTSTTTSTQRHRVLSPGEIANIPTGRALHLDGLQWELLTLQLAHRDEPWRTITQTVAPGSK